VITRADARGKAGIEMAEENEDSIKKGPQAFTALLRMLVGVDREASNQFFALKETLEEYADEYGVKAKGAFTLTLNVEVAANGTMTVKPDFKSKAPVRKHLASEVWITPMGAITARDPRQQQLPGVVRELKRNERAESPREA
jgi:hypothetical protein